VSWGLSDQRTYETDLTRLHLDNANRQRGDTGWRGRFSADALKLLAHQVSVTALDLLFPPQCVHCQRVGSFLCPRCLAQIETAPARTVEGLDDMRVAVAFEGPARSAVHALKYDGVKRLAEPLALLMVAALENVDWSVHMVCPVPLHRRRLQERGYNQSALLARALAERMKWEFCEEAISRVRETETQTHLNAQQRRENVAGAFAVTPAQVEGRCVVVVDDVLTTGATLGACAAALRAAGAQAVYGVALASAVFADAGMGVFGTPGLP